MPSLSKDEQSFFEEFGANIQSARKGRFTQDAFVGKLLVEGVELQRSSIANIERGRQRISIYTACKIAAVLEVPLERLLPSTHTSGKQNKNMFAGVSKEIRQLIEASVNQGTEK